THAAVQAPISRCFDFYFSSRRRHTRSKRDWSSDVCSISFPVRYCPPYGFPEGNHKGDNSVPETSQVGETIYPRLSGKTQHCERGTRLNCFKGSPRRDTRPGGAGWLYSPYVIAECDRYTQTARYL